MSKISSKNNTDLLIIFVKNPVLGKAKTRLAASVGDQKALEIYLFLLQYTASISSKINCDKRVYYSDNIEEKDTFSNLYFTKKLQQKGDLGFRMFTAFQEAFQEGYQRIVLIGSDCYELSSPILNDAFSSLKETTFTIGPAKDGGYYLLGMSQLEPAFFKNKTWSTPQVFSDTILDFKNLKSPYSTLALLSDIDYLEDMPLDLQKKFGL